MIHAVGQASARAPRLIDLTWGRAGAPKVTLVGKGVCFDSGGLDLKPSAAMLTMKKDMGGAATVLAIADMVMGAKLNLRLRVLIPAAENSVSGSAYRPGDVLRSRKGLTVEIGNTDAEGRLVLADALALADDEEPELLIDIATLTGAARSATGMEVPPFFTDDARLATDLMRHGTAVSDPLWRLPLWRGYEATLDSPIADLNNTSELQSRRGGHCGLVPEPLCDADAALGAFRHSGLERPYAAGPQDGRRGQCRARRLRAAGRALREEAQAALISLVEINEVFQRVAALMGGDAGGDG